MTNEIAIIERDQMIDTTPTPEEFASSLAAAQAKASQLKRLIGENNWSVRIGNSDHIRVEAWITLASGYNCTAQIVEGSVRPIEGYNRAFEARAEVLRSTPAGTVVIGAAEAECGTEGDGIWEADQPRYAVRSMAQTRAISKAISSVLRWVVVLAGYSGTPFEDMPANAAGFNNQAQSPRPASDKQKSFLRSLGYDGDTADLSSLKASEIIDGLKQKGPDAGRRAQPRPQPQVDETQEAMDADLGFHPADRPEEAS
mgnify:FL=1